MAKDSKLVYGASGKTNVLAFEPEKLHLVTDKTHPLYDERIHLPISEAMVLNIMDQGVLEPIIVWKPQRDRYITDEEYIAIFTHATPAVKAAMEIAYLCAARVSDVLKMNWNQILDKGIFIQQGKTGIKQIKAWTERLSAAVDICREWGQDGPVIRTMYGERYSYKGFNEAWRKARNAASEELGRPLDCTFHDLKAKGISDYEGSGRDKQKFSGHKTESQVLVYDRKVKISPTLNKKMR